ncbi:MAG: sorbosone dehydrogenase family protein [Chitinophagaceae bacterium]
MRPLVSILLLTIVSFSCVNNNKSAATGDAPVKNNTDSNAVSADTLPAPFATKSVTNYSRVLGWPAGKTPVAPAGFTVTKFAGGLDNPRWIYQGNNGDIFIVESNTVLKGIKKLGAKISRKISTQGYGTSANRIILFRDENKDGLFEKRFVFAVNLNQPFGMLAINHHFYIANTDALLQYDYTPGDTVLKGPGNVILSLPGGGYNNHWTRNILAGPQGDKLYISVGSGSNAAENGIENETRRANILQINTDGSGEKIYAGGLRNPVGMDWEKTSGRLWVAVNERDNLGDELVPDYITSVKEGAFYGWPYSYFGKHADPRLKDNPRTDLVNQAIIPDLALGPHTASLGFTFYNKQSFPPMYAQGAFVGQHGSWNKSALAGYKVIFIPFADGKPSGKPQDFLTGFIAAADGTDVYGRPVGVTVINDGALLVADDAGGTVWQVSYKK